MGRRYAVTFWSPISPRWVAGATVPATSARVSHREAAERQVRELRKLGHAAYAHEIGHMAEAHFDTPPSWTFNSTGRLWFDA